MYIRREDSPFICVRFPMRSLRWKRRRIYGTTFYLPVNGDQVGYKKYPAAELPYTENFLGDDIEDGFCH